MAFHIYTVLVIFGGVITTALALSCFQCDSGEDFRCSEEITGRDLRPLPCVGLSDPQYCIKMTGIFGACGLRCYQCTSLNEYTCGETFDGSQSAVPATECENLYKPGYCVKTTGIFEGQLGTKRFCSEKFLDNYCNYVKRPGDGREYRSCVYTCTGDGCNSATSLPRGPILFLMPIIGLLASMRKML